MPALFTTYAYYNPDKFVYYGEELMKHCMAFRSLLDARRLRRRRLGFQPGPVRAADGHPGHGHAQRLGRHDVGRQSAHQRRARRSPSTRINGAWASGEEAIKGSITAGKLADYVVLADDPHTVDAEKIKDIQIVRTVVGGTISYQS